MPNPPTYSKVNPADTPILTLALTSDTLPLEKVNDLADTVARAKAQRGHRRRPRDHRGQPKARRARAHQSRRARVARPRLGRRAHGADRRTTSTRRKAASTARASPIAIGANDQIFSADRISRTSSSPTATARRFALRDIGDVDGQRGECPAGRLGRHQARGASSTSSASPARTSSRPPIA